MYTYINRTQSKWEGGKLPKYRKGGDIIAIDDEQLNIINVYIAIDNRRVIKLHAINAVEAHVDEHGPGKAEAEGSNPSDGSIDEERASNEGMPKPAEVMDSGQLAS